MAKSTRSTKTALPISAVMGNPQSGPKGGGTPVVRTDLRNTAANSVGGKPIQTGVTTNRRGGGQNW